VIGLIKAGEVLTASALAERIHLDKARTSRLISALTQSGFLNREVAPDNRREVRLSLTPMGQQIRAALMPQAREINRRILSVLIQDEIAQLDNLIHKLQSSAEEVSQSLQHQLPKTHRRLGKRSRPSR
jgi:DNA-binding MarR family transcriptional regulator